MKSKITLIYVALVLFSCTENNSEKKKESKNEVPESFDLKRGTFETSIKIPAEFKAYEQVDLYPKINGYIEKLYVGRGDLVEKNQVLLKINAPEVSAQLAQAQSNYQSSLADELSAEAQYLQSKDDWQRWQQTAQFEGAVSASELFKMQQQYQKDSLGFQAAKMQSKSAEYALTAAKELNNYLVLKSPFDGQVNLRNFHTGAYVSAQQKQPILSLHTPDKLRLEFAVPEEYAALVKDKDSVEIHLKNQSDNAYKLPITRRSGSLEQKMRSEYFEATYLDDKQHFKAGNFAEIKVPIQMNDAFFVPKSCIITTMENQYIEIMNEANGLQRISVNKGPSSKENQIIYGKLKEGMKVVKN